MVKLNSTLPAIRGLYFLIIQDESLREPRIEERLIARLQCVDHKFIPSYLLKHKPSHHLHMHPPRHPSLRNLLRLINQPHIQQKLRSTPNSALKCREDPSVRVARVFANYTKNHKLATNPLNIKFNKQTETHIRTKNSVLLSMEVSRQIQLLLAHGR